MGKDATRTYVSWDGTDDWLACYNYTSPSPHEIFIKIQNVGPPGGNSAPRIFDVYPAITGNAGQQSLRLLQSGNTYQFAIKGVSATSGNIVSNTFYLMDVVFASADNATCYWSNNVMIATNIALSGAGLSGMSHMILGINEPGGSRPNKMYISEMVAYNRRLTDAERTDLANWLMQDDH
jgi:hypothetical protein